jgi:leucyl aminopeptidase
VAWKVRQAAMIVQETLYRFDRLKSKKEEVRRPLRKLTFCVSRRNELPGAEQALAQGLAMAAGVELAKDLGNLPGNICTPTIWPTRPENSPNRTVSASTSSTGPTWKSWA